MCLLHNDPGGSRSPVFQSAPLAPPRKQTSPRPPAGPAVAVLVFHDPGGAKSPPLFNQLRRPAEEAGVASSARRAGGGCAAAGARELGLLVCVRGFLRPVLLFTATS
jgi:hypothetical protein